jgi:site-specific recombinase XerD
MLKKSLPGAAESPGGDLLAGHLDSFVAILRRLGYANSSMRECERLSRDLAQWLRRRDLGLAHLDEPVANQFLEKRRREGRLRGGDASTVHHFLEHLREEGAIRSPEPAADESPLATLRRQYANHLEKQRGLAAATVAEYWPFIRRLLVERFGDGPIHVRDLAPDGIARFLLRHARSGSPKVAKLMVTALRSFFRFLFQHGQTDSDLAGAIPTVPESRLAEVPKYLEPDEVERVVRACQRDTAVARRDHAIVLLLARLGLRASEVIALELDDIDWRAGVLTVRGKGALTTPSRSRPMSARLWPTTCATIGRPARRGASSSEPGHLIGVLPIPVPSARSRVAP